MTNDKHKIIPILCIGIAVLTLASCHPKQREGGIPGEPDAEASPEGPAAGSQLPMLVTGQWYRTATDGRHTAFVIIDEQSADEAQGRYYTTADGAWAMPHTFATTIGRYAVRTAVDGGKAEKTSRRHIAAHCAFEPYAAPPFTAISDMRYRKPLYGISVTHDIVYGHAEGYWTSILGYEDKSYAKVVAEGFSKSLSRRDLPLTLDLYRPEGTRNEHHPLILFIHGGAFYVGDKQQNTIVDWCRHFASMGYVAASMNYRMGFLPSHDDIERAGYMAIQDAHAAMRFLVAHAEEYGINTDEIYAAGASAGSITALNLAFMREEDRPNASRGKSGLFKRDRHEDLGTITGSGNDIEADFHIRAIANMWGAVGSLDILKNSPTSIVSFHGDADQLVPFDKGTPFSDIAEGMGRRLFGEMYGSASIDRKARELGLRSRFHAFAGEGHGFNVDKEGNLNAHHYFIRDSIASFFYREMVPVDAAIVGDRLTEGRYMLNDVATDSTCWKADGGFIVRSESDAVHILWRADEAAHTISATGTYTSGIGFFTEQKVEPLPTNPSNDE